MKGLLGKVVQTTDGESRNLERNEVEHAWGFNRAEEVLEIVDYLAGLTN